MNIEEIKDNFDLFDDWEDKYIYLIELGKKLPDFPEREKKDENLVKGCQSRVWLIKEPEKQNGDLKLKFSADSDSQIVKGLIAVLLSVYSQKTPSEILNSDIDRILQDLELEKHLSGNRTNGLHSMIQKIREYAKEFIN